MCVSFVFLVAWCLLCLRLLLAVCFFVCRSLLVVDFSSCCLSSGFYMLVLDGYLWLFVVCWLLIKHVCRLLVLLVCCLMAPVRHVMLLFDVGLGLFFVFGVCLILFVVGARWLFCLVCWCVFLCC